MGSNPSNFKNVGKTGPVEQVSWEEAVEFCRKLTNRERAAGRLPAGYAYTLPTEAQWEHACRAGTTGAYAGELDGMGWYARKGGPEASECVGALRHARKRIGMVQRLVWGLSVGQCDRSCRR